MNAARPASAAFFVLAALLLAGCERGTPARTVAAADQPAAGLFADIAPTAGIRFRHDSGAKAGKFLFIESTPAGCALLDYDNDNDLDLFFVQSGPSDGSPAPALHPVLYRNDGKNAFTDVTAGSGLDNNIGYGHVVAAADYDNDGDDDLFVTSYAGNRLFRNEKGTGKWTDVTAAVGLSKRHSTGLADAPSSVRPATGRLASAKRRGGSPGAAAGGASPSTNSAASWQPQVRTSPPPDRRRGPRHRGQPSVVDLSKAGSGPAVGAAKQAAAPADTAIYASAARAVTRVSRPGVLSLARGVLGAVAFDIERLTA